jgi:hypothetical protein
MANKMKSSARVRSKPSLVCPECGFKAKHPMGLGRHRSSRHGVVSQRQLAGRTFSDGTTRELAQRVARLEKQYRVLVKHLGKTPDVGVD